MWTSLHSNIQFTREAAEAIEPAGNTVHLARVKSMAGLLIQMTGEHYCEGTIAESTLQSRGRMSTNELFDSVVVELAAAKTIGEAVGGAEAEEIALATQAGIARAHLQAGRKSEASAAAAAVPAPSVYDL